MLHVIIMLDNVLFQEFELKFIQSRIENEDEDGLQVISLACKFAMYACRLITSLISMLHMNVDGNMIFI